MMKYRFYVLFGFCVLTSGAMAFERPAFGDKVSLVEETVALPPGKSSSPSTSPVFVMPNQKSFSQFGGAQQIEDKTNHPVPVCGPSPLTNTLNCFDLARAGSFIGSLPIPGSSSSTPLFYENSWLIGTTKGFLLRIQANAQHSLVPQLGGESLSFWGAHSRTLMGEMRPKVIYTETGEASSEGGESDYKTDDHMPGVKWFFTTSSEPLGTPIVGEGMLFFLSASQYLQAIDWNTGKLAWTKRLAPDTTLRLQSNALTLNGSQLFVGTSLGTLLVLDSREGSIAWSWQVPSATSQQRREGHLTPSADQYSAIVAPPLVSGDNLIVSNAESLTQNVSLASHTEKWAYPAGSVAIPKVYKKKDVIIGANNGRVVSLKLDTGNVNWSVDLTSSSPIVSLFLSADESVLYAVSRRGELFVLTPGDGKMVAHHPSIGEVNGEFFASPGGAACVSLSINGFRCFKAKI